MSSRLNELLKWSVENSTPSSDESETPNVNRSNLDPEVVAALFGGPSDADLMKEAMTVILSPDHEVTLDDRLIAFDNFEQLIENLDNANNLGPLALWSPLLSCLVHEASEIRMMAAWCVGTAVQNNEKSQERLLAQGGLPKLVEMATSHKEQKDVRRKAIYALSSASRNYQPAMDVVIEELGKAGRIYEKVDAADMDAVDAVISGLREEASAAA